MAATAAVVFTFASDHAGAQSSAPSPSPAVPMWGPSEAGPMARVGNTLYVGGGFDYIGPPTGTFAVVDAANASQVTTAARLLKLTFSVVPDGSGGWFVLPADLGLFGSVSSGAGAFAPKHVLPSGALDLAWNAPLAEGVITQMAIDGTRLYLLGSFAAVGGVARAGVAALDVATGALLPFDARLNGGSFFNFMFVDGGVMYLHGSFNTAGGAPRSGFAALDGTTGAALPFATPLTTGTGNLMAASGQRLYGRGFCPQQDITPRLCAYDRAGVPLPGWTAPAVTGTEHVLAMAAGPSLVYSLTEDGGSLSRIRAYDAATGAPAASWTAPAITGRVTTMALAGGSLYVAGAVSAISGQARLRVAALDAATGAVLPWSPAVGGPVNAIAAAQGRVALGGRFSSAGGLARKHLAAFDLTTGLPVGVATPVVGPVGALVSSGDLVVATEATGATSGVLFAFSAATGVRYPVALPYTGFISALEIAGPTLFLGGRFAFGAEPSRVLAAYDLVGGRFLPWNPVLTAVPNPINPTLPGVPSVALLRARGARLYVGGNFNSVNGAARTGGAAFLLGALSDTDWDPRQTSLNAVEMWQDRLLISGYGAQPGNVFSRVRWADPASGDRLNVPLTQAAFLTLTLARAADTIIVGGSNDETTLATAGLIAIDARTGQQQPWDTGVRTPLDFSNVRYTLGFDDLVVVGGSFTVVGQQPAVNLAVFRTTPPAPPRNLTFDASQPVVTMGWTAGGGSTSTAFVIEAGSTSGLGDLGRFPVGSATQVSALVGPGAYALRVFAEGPTGTSAASSEILFTRPAPSAAPSAPAGLTGVVAAGVVFLTWAPVVDATSYVIEGGTAAGLVDLGVLPTGVLDTNIAGPVPSGTYFLRVRAANRFGLSPVSNEVQVVVP